MGLTGDRPDARHGPSSGGGLEPLHVANLLKAQQRLLTGGAAKNAPQRPPEQASLKDDDEPVFGLHDYLDVFSRRLGYLLLPVVLIPVLAWVYASMQHDSYEATSRLLLTRSVVGHSATDDILIGGSSYVTSTALAQVAKLERVRRQASEMIVSWALGEPDSLLAEQWAGKEPAIDRDPSSQGSSPARWSRSGMTDDDREVLTSPETLFRLISSVVNVVPDTQNVSVVLSAIDPSPLVAAAATDALALAMVREFRSLRARSSSAAIIKQHLDANELELDRVNDVIARLRREAAESNESLGGFPLELERQYELLKEQEFSLRSVEFMIQESEERVRFLGQRVTRAEQDVPEALIQNIIDLELKRDELSTRYTEMHPNMRKLNDDIERARRAIQEYSTRRGQLGVTTRSRGYYEPEVQLGLEEAKLAGLRVNRERLKATLAAVQAEIQKTSARTRGIEYERLMTSRRVLQDTAVALKTRLHRAQLADEGGPITSGGVVEAVDAEVRSIGTRRSQTVFLGIIVGAMAGVMLSLFAERLDETVRVPSELRALTGLNTIQAVPLFKRSLVIPPEDAVSPIANVFAVLRNHVRYSATQTPEKCLMLTSSTAGEGKSLMALNLAISFAQEGNRTCLIDADLQKGQRHAIEEAVKFAWEPHIGLTTYLEGDVEIDQIMVPSLELGNLYFIGSGGRAMNPPRALRTERSAHLFARLQDEFDVVIVDAPPVLPVVDAAILSSYCRAVVHVVRHGYTRREEVEEAVRRLRHVDAPLVGILLNCTPGVVASYYPRESI